MVIMKRIDDVLVPSRERGLALLSYVSCYLEHASTTSPPSNTVTSTPGHFSESLISYSNHTTVVPARGPPSHGTS